MSKVVMTYGRMNPPTTGHEKLIHAVHKEAKAQGATAHVIVSHSHDNKKNPVPTDHKVGYVKKVAPKGVNVSSSDKTHPSVLHQASKLHKAGHTHLTMVVGSDRVDGMHKLLHTYNGKEGPHGHYNFKSIKVKSAGHRDPDSEGTEGVSGTKMREHAKNGDHKSFKAGLPKALHPHAKEIMGHVNSNLKEAYGDSKAKESDPADKKADSIEKRTLMRLKQMDRNQIPVLQVQKSIDKAADGEYMNQRQRTFAKDAIGNLKKTMQDPLSSMQYIRALKRMKNTDSKAKDDQMKAKNDQQKVNEDALIDEATVWKTPHHTDEHDEVHTQAGTPSGTFPKHVHKFLDHLKDKKNYHAAMKAGTTTRVSPTQARKLGNTDAGNPKGTRGLESDKVNRVKKLGKTQTKPIVLKDKHTGHMHLLAGNTRLTSSAAKGNMTHVHTLHYDSSKQESVEFDEAVMDVKARIKRKLLMRRIRPKLKRMKKLYSKRRVPEKNLRQRARKAAIKVVRKKVAGKRGASYSSQSPASKMFIDKKVQSKQKIINRIATRTLPKTRKAELVRLSNSFDSFVGAYIQEEPKALGNKPHERKKTPTVASDTKHRYKEKNKKNKFEEPLVTQEDLESLCRKSEESGIPFDAIIEIFIRGMEAGMHEDKSRIENGFGRVNSFISGGAAIEMDADLAEAYRHPGVQNYQRRLKRKSAALRSKSSINSRTSGMFKKRYGRGKKKASNLRRSSSAKLGSNTKRPVGGVSKQHRDLGKYQEGDFRRIHGISKSAMRQRLTREGFEEFKENVPVEFDTNIIAAAANKGKKKKTNKEYILKIGEKKDVPSNPYQKFEGTPEAAAHARKMTPGQVNENYTSAGSGATTSPSTQSQGKTFFQAYNDRRNRGVKSKPIDKDKYFGKKKVEEEKLGKISRTPGGPKKFMVKVKDPSTGNVKTVRFGDPNLSIKRDSPTRRKSFRARHNCDNPGPRTKARYWSCKQWRAGAKVQDGFEPLGFTLKEEFIIEAATDTGKLKHLDHVEDHAHNSGDEGFHHAFHSLEHTHDLIKGKKKDGSSVTAKYDGAPSIVFGHHPKTGKFFVGTKSVFNKDPKINHTEEDIDKNHGHAPGLAAKLKHALKHLPKVTPKGKVYQGDLMHSGVKSKSNPEGDVEHKEGKYHFKPNTISYSTKKDSDHGKKIASSKIGVVPHTEYKGKDLESMKAHFNADVSQMKSHKDVHVISPHHDMSKVKHSEENQKGYEHHMKKATEHFNKIEDGHHEAIGAHAHNTHINTYINKTVREGSKPSVNGYKDHVKDHYQKKADKVKTDAAKEKHIGVGKEHTDHVDANKKHFQRAFDIHHHLQSAKNHLVKSLSTHQDFDHHIGGVKSKGEGFVVSKDNKPSKLVDRAEFSRANFLSGKPGEAK